ncbi:hypothetical protein GCM10022213_13990 [Parerythrobacter jejuensis]
MQASTRYAAAALVSLIGPLLVLSGLISLAGFGPRQYEFWAEIPWFVWLGICLIPGIIGIEALPVVRRKKAVLTGIYLPLGFGALFFYALWYSCAFYGGCL